METVIQDWVAEECSWKEQTVLLTALRGCDGDIKMGEAKGLQHNYRGVVLGNADIRTTFMEPVKVDIKNFCNNLDHYPMHFLVHLTHGIEIIGYRHPDEKVAYEWRGIYLQIVKALHFAPEPRQVMIDRLEDYR